MNVVLITGGSSGIGASTAIECAARGMGVILTYHRHPEGGKRIVSQITAAGGNAIALPLDVSATETFPAFKNSLEKLLLDWKRADFDVLINNAGFGLFNPIETVTVDQFDSLFNVHLKGPFFLTQSLLPLLAEGSQIVNVTSATTRVATAGVAPYAAFKGALEVLTRYMAKEFGPRNIRANAISPGAIRTKLGGGLNDEFETLLASQTALARVGEPEDVARAIAGLIADENRWINAQSIEVAGGYQI
ncbi:SDR family NAD(P)-dependent oxidoreductase [Erwinia billingiae]|uniref:SDR family NAD(P)-dependent oxidoreductase n=1 Tax=Erwinia billingiae TaxID=182337 RepID=UPI002246E99F|nr:SDR family oxidoreductase [Erwinia billingiae]MCX0500259.1 SDR family oxidoreductase [Erwinia billingiae]